MRARWVVASGMAAFLTGGCAIGDLGADFTVYDGGDIVMVERRAAGAQIDTSPGGGFTLGRTITRVGLSRTAFEACGSKPRCAFGMADALFIHRDAAGLDIQPAGPAPGIVLGRASTFSIMRSQPSIDSVFGLAYDSIHPDLVGGCLGWESCERYWP